ncbi:MAG: hypothetical protein WC846_00220 [Candidatus Gracilibacteria bacterium]|jgi:hypothetical protein
MVSPALTQVEHGGEWKKVDAAPVNSEEFYEQIENTFGPRIADALTQGLHQTFEALGEKFFLSLAENTTGGILKIEFLEPLPPKELWPSAVTDWINCGGFLELENPELYAAIMMHLSETSSGLLVSLEKEIKYELVRTHKLADYSAEHSTGSLVHQKEFGLHFLSLKEAIYEAENLHVQTLGINGFTLTENEKDALKKLSKFHPVMVAT